MLLDHVALVLPEVDTTARRLGERGLAVGAAEEFESENTREIYVETAPARVLLVAPRSSAGPIGRHVSRRGHGFHHLGFATTDVRAVLRELRGWLVCPATYRNLERNGPAWLARPDARLLVELTQVEALQESKGSPTLRDVSIRLADLELGKRLLAALGLEGSTQLVLQQGEPSGIESVSLEVGGRRLTLRPTGEVT